MTTFLRAAVDPRTGSYPLSWSWKFRNLALAAGETSVRSPMILDALNNTGFPVFAPFDLAFRPVIGFEESFSIHVLPGGAANVTLRREFSLDNLAWFLVLDTALTFGGVTTSILANQSQLRFPAYPRFRYSLINTDVGNGQTLTGCLTLRAR